MLKQLLKSSYHENKSLGGGTPTSAKPNCTVQADGSVLWSPLTTAGGAPPAVTSTLNEPLVLCAEHERAVCFQRKFIDEVRKADAFYTGKIDALERTLDYLQTSCATELPHKQRRDDDDDENNAARFAARGLGQKRSRQSMKRACPSCTKKRCGSTRSARSLTRRASR